MRRSIKVRCFFWLYVLLFPLRLHAQELEPRFKTISSKDGLSQNVVNTIFQDSKSFIWFGTQDGLNRFDGYNFKVFRYDPEDSASISDNWIAAIFMEDADGDIWMITGDLMINVYSPRYEKFHKIATGENSKSLPPFNRVSMIAQDKLGFVWISTNKGLFKISKQNWEVETIFKMDEKVDKPRFFPKFYEDKDHNLWFYSTQGLMVYDSKKRAIRFDTYSEDRKLNRSNQIIGLFGDSKNNILVFSSENIFEYSSDMKMIRQLAFGHLLLPKEKRKPGLLVKAAFPTVKEITQDNYLIGTSYGLVFFDRKNLKLTSYLPSENKNSISGSEITAINKDKNGDIWIGTTRGMNRFDIQTQTFNRVTVDSQSEFSGGVLEIFADKTGTIWVTDIFKQGDGNRLCYLDKGKMKLVQVKNNPVDPYSVPTEFILRPFHDKEGNYWFGTFGSGVFRLAPFQKKFYTLKHKIGVENSLAGNSAWAMAEDLQGRIWITMHQDGLDCYDPATNTYTHHGDKLRKFLNWKNLVAISLVCDKENTLWIGTLGAGLVSFDLNTNKMTHYYAGQGSPHPISNNSIAALSQDHHGNILISYSFFGFDILNPKTGEFRNFNKEAGVNNNPVNDAVRIVTHDRNDNYWISFDGLIARLDSKTGKMTHYFSKKNKGRGIVADKASCIFEDSKNRIWVGTHGGGLSLYDPSKDEFLYWTEKNGLINNVVYGILEDNAGRLWLSTNNGLSCFDPNSEKFINYYDNDGLQGSEFNANSYLKARNGYMYFGGINGITRFNPSEITSDPVVPAVSITGLQIYNKKVEVIPSAKSNLLKAGAPRKLISYDNHLYLPCNISYTDELEIDYKHKVITFEFSALRFDMQERCTFMYKMEGFEKDWNVAGNRRFATYTNLPPGEYFFKVTAANSDGIWNPEPAKIRIVIKPPFYLTWWFISFGIASLIIATTSYVMKREKNLKRTKTILEEKVKLRTHELNEKNEELMLRNIQILKQKEEIATQAKRLRYELDIQNQTSEQALLRSQINPHFLFNTLNNIYSLVYQKSSSAPEALMKLSDIMRYMLYDTSADMVFLDKEVQYLRSFIDLHMLRLKNKDFVSFDVIGDPAGKQIAPMLLIAFVENAFKHGNKSVPSPGIQIALNCASNKLRFDVKNYKNTSAAKDSLGGIGLANVKRRLELIYHDKYKLEIHDLDVKFEVNLIISTLTD